MVTDIAPLVRTATPTVHSGDDAKGCFEQLISSGASYLVVLGEAEQVEGIASLDFQRALTISTAAAWGVWLLFVALAVYMVKKSSGKPRPKRV